MAKRITKKTNGSDEEPAPGESVLITGFPSYTAEQLARYILAEDDVATLHLLADEANLARARDFVASLGSKKKRVRVITGRVDAMDLGLSGHEYQALRDSITTIQHLAGAYSTSNNRKTLERVNVVGTRNVLEFAREARRLRRMCHWSTAFVSGKRRGVILEEELDEGQTFHNAYEETKYEAEVCVRNATRHIPVTVFRPSVIVGDTKRGEISEYDGPYYLIGALAGRGIPLSISGLDHSPCHVVPIDYVIEAAYELSQDERAAGVTFHLTDPNPLPTRLVLELLATESNSRLPLIPASLARTLMRTPGIERFTRSLRPLIESLSEGCFFNCRTTLAYLRDTTIQCPPLDTYVEELVEFSRSPGPLDRLETDEDTFDPFQ